MAKRFSDKQKSELINSFKNGTKIKELSKIFSCTNATITRHLKNFLGVTEYKEYINKNKLIQDSKKIKKKNLSIQNKKNYKKNVNEINNSDNENLKNITSEDLLENISFVEIPPCNYEIESQPQKDLSSVPITEVRLPKTVYMIVNDKIELEIKPLRDYPNWQFLSDDELNRKTIEIFFDLKVAKGSCSKDKKLIKVPNTDVFRIVAPILISRGISRIVSTEKLIAL